jgi:hypothetical protein
VIAANKDSEPENDGGRGEGPFLTPVQQNKIVGMMTAKHRRWKLTKAAKMEAIATTLNNMADEDGRVRNAAVANLVRMEAQNMADQHKLIEKQSPSEAASVTNQQINIYLPANSREAPVIPKNTNGNGNGKH